MKVNWKIINGQTETHWTQSIALKHSLEDITFKREYINTFAESFDQESQSIKQVSHLENESFLKSQTN